jgi:peptidoglycan/LPS O-acetylase OafA/YrhL
MRLVEGVPVARQAGGGGERPHLLALDGLRFVAAFFVMAAHGYWYLICFQNADNVDALAHAIITLASYGMTLFFVLSGFVIHLNYRESIQQSGGLWHFLSRAFRACTRFSLPCS